MTRPVAALGALLLLTPCARAKPRTLADYKAICEKQLAAIARDCEAGHKEARAVYAKSLQRIKDTYQAKGALDGTIAATREMEQLAREGTIPATSPDDLPEPVGKARATYHATAEAAELDRQQRTISLLKKYLPPLEALKRRHVRKNELEQATQVDEEIKRAEFILADLESQSREPEPPESSATKPAPPPAPAAPPSSEDVRDAKSFRTGARIYRGSKPPAVKARKPRLWITGPKSVAGSSKLTASLAVQSIKGDETDDNGFRHIRRHEVPRIMIKVGRAPLGDCLLVYEFFGKAGARDFKKLKTERITLQDLRAGEQLAVDPVGYRRLIKRLHVHDNGYSHEWKPDTGYQPEMYGFIASIYDSTGQILFQKTSMKNLAEHAGDSPPAE